MLHELYIGTNAKKRSQIIRTTPNSTKKRAQSWSRFSIQEYYWLSTLLTTWRLRERPEYQGRATSPLLTSLMDIWRNPHARPLLLVFGIETFGTSSIVMLVPYLTEYVLTEPGSDPMAATPIVASYFLGNFGLTPLWR